MKKIFHEQIVNTVANMCIQAGYELPDDVLQAILSAKENETNDRARTILEQLIENARIAKNDRIPLCQDTGLAVVFIEQGQNTVYIPPDDAPDSTLTDAVNAGVEMGYQTGLLRKSVVAEPLNSRTNTNSNTPCIIHYSLKAGDDLKISIMAKGGGCENKSQFKMFNPTDPREKVAEWIVHVVKEAGANACPPFVIGIGLGGDFEQCCMISKKALLRPIQNHHPDNYYADMEKNLLNQINASKLGPQGLGGNTTALAVHIETAPCHIASLPAAVNIECHAHRHKTAIL